MQDHGRYFPTNGYILGDSAYPLNYHLIVPFPQSECIHDERKKQFNAMLSSSRVAIERAFGTLVARWRFLALHIYILDLLDINDVISSCCILHNICINNGAPQFEEDPTLRFYSVDENDIELTEEVIAERNENPAGRERRNALFHSIFG